MICHGVVETRRRVLAGSESVEQTVRAALMRIRQYEPAVRAWVCLAEADALEQARRLDALPDSARAELPLLGTMVGVKDVIHVSGLPTRAGSPILDGYTADRDAGCVERLRRAGAVVLGKTETTEFAFYDPAPTRNPRNRRHTPGGSSSGSAAAVAAGFCQAALGTQTFGSVIRPASYCGVVGLKPTYDAIGCDGVIPLARSLDHVGFFTRSVEDATAMAGALMGTAMAEAGARTAGVPDRYFEPGDGTVQSGFAAGLEALGRSGVAIRKVTLPPLFEQAVAAAGILLRAEAAAAHRKWFPERAREYGPKLRSILEAGLEIGAVEYLRMCQVRREAIAEMLEFFQQIDVLVTPATPTVAPEGLTWTGDPVYNTPFSAIGFPAITVPCGESEAGLPGGFQMVGVPWSEGMLLRTALTLQQAGFGEVAPPRFEEEV